MDKDKGCCKSLHHSTRAAATLAVLVVDLTPFWLERLDPESQCGRTVACLTKVTPLRLGREILAGKRRDEASHDGDRLHAWCEYGVSAPSKIVITTDRVWNGRAPALIVSLVSRSCSLAAANDTRDAIALSRRTSPKPSEPGIALVFPALIQPSQYQYRTGAGSTLLEREAQDSWPKTKDVSAVSTSTLTPTAASSQGLVSSRPLCLASFPSPTAPWAGAHRPTATRRLPSRRTTLDAGATAAKPAPTGNLLQPPLLGSGR
ncbi:hypothetical protein HDV64DRAFT_276122 [Trichoderma sp. TUCIM 5745]